MKNKKKYDVGKAIVKELESSNVKLKNINDRLVDIRRNTDSTHNNIFAGNVILIIIMITLIISVVIQAVLLNNVSKSLQSGEVSVVEEVDYLTEGYIDGMNKYNLFVNGKTYTFCKSDITFFRMGDYVRVIKEAKGFGCGEVLQLKPVNETNCC